MTHFWRHKYRNMGIGLYMSKMTLNDVQSSNGADCHILKIFFEDFMRNSNFGIGVLHAKRQILTYFLWGYFSASSSFYCFIWYGIQRGDYKKKYWKFSIAQFLWYDGTFKKQCTAPMTLTFDLWRSILFGELITTLYVSCIDISVTNLGI